jgi:hypothetical protein
VLFSADFLRTIVEYKYLNFKTCYLIMEIQKNMFDEIEFLWLTLKCLFQLYPLREARPFSARTLPRHGLGCFLVFIFQKATINNFHCYKRSSGYKGYYKGGIKGNTKKTDCNAPLQHMIVSNGCGAFILFAKTCWEISGRYEVIISPTITCDSYYLFVYSL